MKNNTTSAAFSIIEVLIGIFVFSLGLVSIYALLSSSLQVNEYNKNAIIASNLAREQLELYKNIRDTNYKKLKVWNQINPTENYDASRLFEIGKYYTLENNFSPASVFSISVNEIISFWEWKDELNNKMQNYRLCINDENIYTYDCTTEGNRETPFYRYLFIQQAKDAWWNTLEWAYHITSKVIWYKRGYHDFDIKTIVTDWRRI